MPVIFAAGKFVSDEAFKAGKLPLNKDDETLPVNALAGTVPVVVIFPLVSKVTFVTPLLCNSMIPLVSLSNFKPSDVEALILHVMFHIRVPLASALRVR